MELEEDQDHKNVCGDNIETTFGLYGTSTKIQDQNFKRPREKCGEIFKIDSGNVDDEMFNFLCTYCSTLFEDFIAFTAHIIESHNTEQENETIQDALEEVEIKLEPSSPINIDLIHNNIYVQELEIISNVCAENYTSLGYNNHSENENENLKKGKLVYSVKNSYLKKANSKAKITMFCDICDKKFYAESTLESHMKYDHMPINPFLETIRTSKTSNQDLVSSKTIHGVDECDDDCRVVSKQEYQETNIADLLPKYDDSLSCRYCKKRFDARLQRFEHECLHTGEKSYQCEICNKRFRQKGSLLTHIAVHKNERNFKCEFCGKGFNTTQNLDTHVRRHTGDKRYKCEYCDKTFVVNHAKKSHERIHTGEKPYQCAECGKKFSHSSAFSMHKIRHSSERPFKCDYCDKGFKDNTARKIHERTHNKSKRYKCSYCDKTLINNAARKIHERTHTGERPYQCAQCGKNFNTTTKLSIHKRKHTGEKPHKCDYCDKRFSSTSYKKIHETIHTGLKPFSCDICNTKFSHKKALSDHTKIHSNVNSYNCKICGRGFKQHAGLYGHMKIHAK